jgi:hypothetical protein
LIALEVNVAHWVPLWTWPGAGVLLASAAEILQYATPLIVVARAEPAKRPAARQGSNATVRKSFKVVPFQTNKEFGGAPRL